METTLRNATLADLAGVLEEQKDAKRDIVCPAGQISSEGGLLRVPGMDVLMDEEGVNAVPGLVRPTAVCDKTLADKLGIPIRYLRDVRASQGLTVPDYAPMRDLGVYDDGPLIDAIVNAHLGAHGKNVLVRAFHGVGDPTLPGIEPVGIGRAVLSDRFAPIDHLDVLYAALEAARAASVSIEVGKVNLSERSMRVTFTAPEITALAPTLLAGYRAPRDVVTGFDGNPGLIRAGIESSDSEAGGGAFQVAPRFVVLICSNGMTMTKDAIRAVHVGGRLDEGLIKWSEDTQRKNLDLIAAKTKDAVTTFLDTGYMERVIAQIEEQAGRPVEKPDETIRVIAQRLRYSETERETLLAHFIEGGQVTAGGVLNAVTSLAQVVADPDRAAEIEAGAFDAMALAGTVR